MVVWHLKQVGKVNKFDKWVPHELTEYQKDHCFEVSSSLTVHNNNKSFLNRIVTWDEKWILYHNGVWPAQWLDWEDAPKTSQSQTCTQKGHGHYLVVCCLSDPLQLSESWWNHYIWEVCSANLWDSLKTAKPAAILITEWAQFLSTTMPDHMSHNQHFKSWMYWATKFCLICHIHLSSCSTTTTFSSISTSFFRENGSPTSRRQKILSKCFLKPEAWILMLYN